MPEEIDKDLSWKWLVQSDLKVQNEATICAAQEQALRTYYTKNNIDKTSENPLCRICSERGKTVQRIICECKKLVQREYKRNIDLNSFYSELKFKHNFQYYLNLFLVVV